jgi:reactive intermediate/imine deaminase
MKFINTGSSRSGAHYSSGVIHNGLLFISGQLSLDPATGKVPAGGIAAEARQALKNLEAVLTAAGGKKTDVLQCRVYTPNVDYWDEINTVYAEFFGKHKPARCVVPTTQLHFGCLVEIEAVAVLIEPPPGGHTHDTI